MTSGAWYRVLDVGMYDVACSLISVLHLPHSNGHEP